MLSIKRPYRGIMIMGKLSKKNVMDLLKNLKQAETEVKLSVSRVNLQEKESNKTKAKWGRVLFDSRVFNGSNMSKQAKHDFNNRLYSYSSLDDDFLLNSQEPLNFD